MYKVGIFYGSDTGNTKRISFIIKNKLINYFKTKILDISLSSIDDFLNFDILLLGTSTWYHGELQYDWDNFLNNFNNISLDNKIVAFFGCGNQKEYGDCFCNGVYKLYNIFKKKNVIILGYWPIINYKFNHSKSIFNNNYFIGLMLDEHNQSKLTNKRISIWISKIIVDIYNIL